MWSARSLPPVEGTTATATEDEGIAATAAVARAVAGAVAEGVETEIIGVATETMAVEKVIEKTGGRAGVGKTIVLLLLAMRETMPPAGVVGVATPDIAVGTVIHAAAEADTGRVAAGTAGGRVVVEVVLAVGTAMDIRGAQATEAVVGRERATDVMIGGETEMAGMGVGIEMGTTEVEKRGEASVHEARVQSPGRGAGIGVGVGAGVRSDGDRARRLDGKMRLLLGEDCVSSRVIVVVLSLFAICVCVCVCDGGVMFHGGWCIFGVSGFLLRFYYGIENCPIIRFAWFMFL